MIHSNKKDKKFARHILPLFGHVSHDNEMCQTHTKTDKHTHTHTQIIIRIKSIYDDTLAINLLS